MSYEDDLIFNPREARKFASDLTHFSAELKDSTGALLSKLRQLGDTWRDPKYHEFADELERSVYGYLEKFQEVSELVRDDLIKRAERASAVHN